MPVTRGFVGQRRPPNPRLPPGQSDVGDGFPVLAAELAPTIDTATWTMTVDGLVDSPTSWTWGEIHALPGSEYNGDIHCVTTWSKFDTSFGGLSVDVLLDAAMPSAEATFVLATSVAGYTTNLLLDDIRGGNAWIVWSHEGAPLPLIHGGPIRLLVPHLYFWKSAKWSALSPCSPTTSSASGSRTAITCAEIRGSSSGTPVTEPAAGDWQTAVVRQISRPSPRLVILRLEVANRVEQIPGQDYVVRLTAEDGYTTARNYSCALRRQIRCWSC